MTLGLFVPRFGRLGLIGSGLAILGRSVSAGFGGLVLFRGRLLLDRLFLLLSRLVTGSGKIHHLAGMCRGGIVLAGSGRLLLFLFSLGDFGRGRLLHLGVGNSVGGIGHGIAHFKERRLPLMLQHDRDCAMLDTCVYRMVKYRFDLRRLCRCGDIPVLRCPAKETVTHASTYRICLKAMLVERVYYEVDILR